MPETLPRRDSSFTRDQYRTLLEVAEAIAAHRDLGALLHQLAGVLPRIVPFDFINLVLHDSQRGVIGLELLVTPEPTTIEAGLELLVETSPGGLVWKTQEPLLVEDVETEVRFPELTPRMLENGVRSFCGVPLTSALR